MKPFTIYNNKKKNVIRIFLLTIIIINRYNWTLFYTLIIQIETKETNGVFKLPVTDNCDMKS